MVSMKPIKWFQGFQKTTFFQKYPSISSKNSTNVVEFYSDIVGYFSKKGVFLKPLSCSKSPRYTRVTIQKLNKMLKNCVFLKKNRPGWSNFFEKTVIFFQIWGNCVSFRVAEWCNFSNFDAFAAKWSFVKITLV